MVSAALAPASTRRIDLPLRRSLDAVRALAAVYVVVHHVVVNSSLTGPVTYPFRFGQEAVIIFFLLSGFLIFSAEEIRVQTDLKGYYYRRIRRIYPLVISAFAVSAIVAFLDGKLAESFSTRTLVLNLFALQDVSALKLGVITDPFLGNSPLWSLSYEVFFYLVFPLVMVARRVSRNFALATVGIVSLAGYGSYLLAPNHFSLVAGYLLVWWAGAVVADLYKTGGVRWGGLAPLMGWLTALCAVAAASLISYPEAGVGVFPLLPLRHFMFTFACIAVFLTLPRHTVIKFLSKGGTIAAFIASISYGLYVFHYPLLIQWEWAQTPLGGLVAGIALITCAILGDRVLDQIIPRQHLKLTRES